MWCLLWQNTFSERGHNFMLKRNSWWCLVDYMQKWLGGIHKETVCRVPVGHLLSVWGGICTSGKVESLLCCSCLTRTRLAHQTSTLCLAKLQKKIFISTSKSHNDKRMEIWKKQMVSKNPTLQCWNTIFSLEFQGLVFDRSPREANFGLYLESLKEMTPFHFIFCP